MSDNKRIAKNTIFLYIRMFLVMGISLYTSRIVFQVLGEVNYGIFGVVGGIIAIFSFLNGSLGGATSRYITIELGKKDYVQLNKVFNVAVVIHFFLAIIIVFFAETLGVWLFYNKMVIPESRMDIAFWVYQISILMSFFSITQVPYQAVIVAHENMKIYAYMGIFDVVMKLLLVFLLQISVIDKLLFWAILLCCVQFLTLLIYHIYCVKHYDETRLVICRDRFLYKGMFAYAASDLIGNISVLAQGQGLNILLNMFFGPVVNAARNIAYQVQGAVTQFGGNFMAAVRPQIIKLYAVGNIKEMLNLVYLSSCFSFYLIWIIALPVCLESEYILSLWLGQYPNHTISFLNLVIVLCLIQTLKTPRTTVYHATGHLKFVNMVVGGVLCAAFPLAYLFLKLGGVPEMVFVAANISMIISEFVSVFILKKYIDYSIGNYLLNVHCRCFVVLIISFIIPYFLFDRFMQPSFMRLIITCIITTLSVIITSFCIGVNAEDRIKILNLLKSKILKK